MQSSVLTAGIALPGLIDCHVHFREPGLEHKATIASEAAAARRGGIFTVCEMPNTNPPTNTIAALADKVRRADACRSVCDVRFFFGATAHAHLKELEELFTNEAHAELRRHCSGLKLYLDNSTGDMKSDDDVTEAAFELCGRIGIVLVAHCEHSCTNDCAAAATPYTTPITHSIRRPAKSEIASIAEAIDRATRHKTRLHIAHLSTSGGLTLVREARKAGVTVTCEITPHHLFMSTRDYETLLARGKVNPPLRDPEERDGLWQGLLSGEIDCVSTDHAPHLLSEKDSTTGMPPSGLPGVETSLQLMLSVALGHWPHPKDPVPAPLAAQPLTVADLVRCMFTRPNEIFGLGASDAPRLRVEPSDEKVIVNDEQVTKCAWTPYHGWKVKGSFKEIA